MRSSTAKTTTLVYVKYITLCVTVRVRSRLCGAGDDGSDSMTGPSCRFHPRGL